VSAGEAEPPPPGFEPTARAPFMSHVGPILQAVEAPPGTIRLGLRVAPHHLNTMGYLHGGMAAALADSAMARALNAETGRKSVTLKMTLEYLEAVAGGAWVQADARVTARDDDLAFTLCELSAGGKPHVRASAMFRLLRRS
jgi:uncharacterized protein (TIGR00369 family)